jgi:hypothetical protein
VFGFATTGFATTITRGTGLPPAVTRPVTAPEGSLLDCCDCASWLELQTKNVAAKKESRNRARIEPTSTLARLLLQQSAIWFCDTAARKEMLAGGTALGYRRR